MKQIMWFVLGLVLSAGLVSAQEDFMCTGSDLESLDDANLQGMFQVFRTRMDNLDHVDLHSQLTDGNVSSDTVLEGWLVDDDTDYWLSVGAFMPAGSRQILSYESHFVSFDLYDRFVVTEEPLNDLDPNPGTPVFEADVAESQLSQVDENVTDNATAETIVTGAEAVENETSAEADQTEENATGNETAGAAGTEQMEASLSGADEVPPVETDATGQGSFVLDTNANTLTYDITYSGLTSPETAAHFHGPAGVGEAAPPVEPLPMGEAKTGVWNYDDSMEQAILDGLVYVNVHSENYPDGEIRGQVLPS